ncbi:hypothetical protein EYF80_020226 [Liparis tanakae]|uniref:Uncharacterized protein n=1 Tax=Liparis tanakae TaxID=230148 RepID=A0A4Z2HVH0_9TELE|nr:hypothetical protein EYF80_020226 [Liparis tanakae]
MPFGVSTYPLRPYWFSAATLKSLRLQNLISSLVPSWLVSMSVLVGTSPSFFCQLTEGNGTPLMVAIRVMSPESGSPEDSGGTNRVNITKVGAPSTRQVKPPASRQTPHLAELLLSSLLELQQVSKDLSSAGVGGRQPGQSHRLLAEVDDLEVHRWAGFHCCKEHRGIVRGIQQQRREEVLLSTGDSPMGSLAKTGLDGGLGSPAPTMFSALTLNSYSQPCSSSVTQYSTFGWIVSVLQRTHLEDETAYLRAAGTICSLHGFICYGFERRRRAGVLKP